MDESLDFFNAIAQGDDTTVVRILRERPALARALNTDSLPALVFARALGHRAILQMLIDTGPPLDAFQASMIDDTDRLRDLLDADLSRTTAYDSAGFTPLHYASYYGAPGAVRLLLERGADTEAVTKNFLANMALHAAAAGGHREICEALLGAGADVNATQHHGFKPLHTAGFRDDRAMADLFLSHGADPSATNEEGKTAADFAAQQGHAVLAAYLRAHQR